MHPAQCIRRKDTGAAMPPSGTISSGCVRVRAVVSRWFRLLNTGAECGLRDTRKTVRLTRTSTSIYIVIAWKSVYGAVLLRAHGCLRLSFACWSCM